MQPIRPPQPGQNRHKRPRSIDGMVQTRQPVPHASGQQQRPPTPNYMKAAPIRRPSDYRDPGHKPAIAAPQARTAFAPPPSPPPVTQKVANGHRAAPKKAPRIGPGLRLAAVIIGCSVLGLLSFNLALGQAAVGVYGVGAVLFRIKSQATFTLALMALVCVPLLLLLGKDRAGLAENFAVYAFLLLVIGVISAAIELRQDNKRELQA